MGPSRALQTVTSGLGSWAATLYSVFRSAAPQWGQEGEVACGLSPGLCVCCGFSPVTAVSTGPSLPGFSPSPLGWVLLAQRGSRLAPPRSQRRAESHPRLLPLGLVAVSWVPAWCSGPAWYRVPPSASSQEAQGPILSPPSLPAPLPEAQAHASTFTFASSSRSEPSHRPVISSPPPSIAVASVRDWGQFIWTLARSRCSTDEPLLGRDTSPSLRPARTCGVNGGKGPVPAATTSGAWPGGPSPATGRVGAAPLGPQASSGGGGALSPPPRGQWLPSASGAPGTSGG